MHFAIIIVGLQLVDIVDYCNYHNCIMGPFSFVSCPERPKTGSCPLCTGPYKKSKNYINNVDIDTNQNIKPFSDVWYFKVVDYNLI